MGLINKLKSGWNNHIKPIVKSPYSYFSLIAFLGGGFANAQSGQAHLHGKITGGTTTIGIENVEVKYKQLTPNIDSITTNTNNYGEYDFLITDVEKEENNIESGIETMTSQGYASLNITTEKDDNANITIFNMLGEKVKEYTQKLNTGTNEIRIPTNDIAQAVYATIIQTSEKTTITEFTKSGQEINWLKTKKTTENKKNNLDKIVEGYTYTIEFRDLTETHHPYIIKYWEPLTLGPENEYNTPLLKKGNIEIPFNNPRNGQPVITNRDLLFYMQGVDILQYIAYKTTVKPLLTHLDIQELPPQYTEQQIRDATLEILTETGMPLDSIYQETTEYINPVGITESTIGYKFLTNGEMEGSDLIISDIIDGQTLKKSYIFKFNKETIEPEHIKKFIKFAWYGAIQGGVILGVPGYFSSDPRDTTINNLSETEKDQFGFLFQPQDVPMWISDENIPENNYDRPEHKATKQELEQFLSEQQKPYALYFKQVGDVYEMTKKIIEEQDLRFK